MPVRFRREARCVVLAVCALGLAAGCVESTYVWSLNPGGSGKVEIDARVQPPLNPFNDDMDPTETPPDLFAKGVARGILKKSEGVAAWTGVSSGIADDGRVLFKGTAYFDDLAKVKIEGDSFPMSILRPSLVNEGDGRLVVGLQIDDVSMRARDRGGVGTGPGISRSSVETGELMKNKVAYQAAKPVLTAFFSTMRTETIVRLPGTAAEVSNFRVMQDGALALTFDGPKLIVALDSLAARDPDAWLKMVSVPGGEGESAEELRRHLNELLFGERAPVRAVFRGAREPLFNYARELAGVTDARIEASVDAPAVREPDIWLDGSGSGGYWKLSGGPLASARTDLGTGTGWTGIIGGGGFLDMHMLVEVSRVEYENSDGDRRELHRATVGGAGRLGPVVVGGGLAWSFGPGDIWATGPQLTIGVGASNAHTELYLVAAGYAWFGERDDEFDFDVEADVRLVAGIRF
jgi:hypothetical protein